MNDQEISKWLSMIAFSDRQDIMAFFHDIDCSFHDRKNQNALFPSIARGKELTDFFIKRGADINLQNIDGNSPLHLAAAHMDLTSLRHLIEEGADLTLENKFGNQPLWTALLEGIKVINKNIGCEIIEYLISSGADMDHKNHAGMSPRFFCEQNVKDVDIRSLFLIE